MALLRRALRAVTASPARMAATAAVITPGMHVLMSNVVEQQRVTWTSDYPALLVGDPMLAVAAGLASRWPGPPSPAGALALEATRRPRQGHGTVDWGRLLPRRPR